MPSRSTSTKKPSPSPCTSRVQKKVLSSPVGNILVTLCEEGLHSVGLEGDISDENFSPNEREVIQWMDEVNSAQTKMLTDCLSWFKAYFKDPALMDTVPRPEICCLRKSELGFRARVWQTLADTVGPGKVITYGALAARLKNPGAVRAVGSAMRNNPVAIIVPCHRVVRCSDMGLYHGGKRQTMKKWLLKHEGVDKY